MSSRTSLTVLVGVVVVALLLAVRVAAPGDRGEPCVDFIPAHVACAIDSPAAHAAGAFSA